MKSNDRIPKDEMLLAEACAAVVHNGFTWVDATIWADADSNVLSAWTWNDSIPVDAAQCCAVGALALADGESRKFAVKNEISIGWGNDHSHDWMGGHDRGESLGWAFRCFMTQDESDPDTERLIRERSGK